MRYRPNVGIVLQNSCGQIFIGRRVHPVSSCWQMPQGGINEGELPEAAMWREVQEEIGTTKAVIVNEMSEWLRYDFPGHVQSQVWNGDYVGQEQKWFLLRFAGTDKDINIVTAHPEFSEWKWASPSEVVRSAVDFKRDVYRKVLKFFAISFDA
jgi:putative (di)nucleoside polyphosphate hydrolase